MKNTPACIGLALLCACGPDGPTTVDDPAPSPDPAVPVEATQWLVDNVASLTTTNPEDDFSDLEPLRTLIGNARVVALGEGTHGTREFFRMKDRLLRFLVTEMGFDAFAIEATWPEANRLDDYVRTGVGDPEQLLSSLYFWTWNTESVLEMIGWMRTHNESGGDLGFYGFDMQFPGMALANVERFLAEVDSQASAVVAERLECLTAFANGPDGRFPTPGYADQSLDHRQTCRANLSWALDTLRVQEERYVAASSREAFERAVQSVRVALQWERWTSGGTDGKLRDEAMAENARWLIDRLGPDRKIVLWAHNYHVSRRDAAMGGYLDPVYGDDMVVLGFAFGSGQFTAVTMAGSSFIGLATQSTAGPLTDSYEEYFASAELPQFLLDLRGHDLTAPGASWLAGPRTFRFIGCCYDPDRRQAFAYQARLPAEFDGMIYVHRTTPTRLLPFDFPPDF